MLGCRPLFHISVGKVRRHPVQDTMRKPKSHLYRHKNSVTFGHSEQTMLLAQASSVIITMPILKECCGRLDAGRVQRRM